jgi:hypothetical protein
MTRRHVIDLALDLARMPALAQSAAMPPLPPDMLELIRIAAAAPVACEDAASATGEPVAVVVEAARFYLQQLLFRPDADAYRVLGIRPGDSRTTARTHMRWLLQWLHPDRNTGLDAVYAERVLEAWREVSHSEMRAAPSFSRRPLEAQRARGVSRVPWIRRPNGREARPWLSRPAVRWAVPFVAAILFVALCSVLYVQYGLDQTIARIAEP